MRRYETIIIIDPDLSSEGRQPLLEKIKGLISQYDGFLAEIDEWGSRRLAYDIKKRSRGYYIRLDYCGTGPLVDEMERYFRITDPFLKFLTIVTETEIDLDKIKEEVARAKTEEEAAEPETAEAPESTPVATEEAETDTEETASEPTETNGEEK